jgi:hypothetical protein
MVRHQRLGKQHLAVAACIGAAIVRAVALAAVPWMKPRGLRIVIAMLFGATC